MYWVDATCGRVAPAPWASGVGNPEIATYGPPTGGGDILDSKTAATLDYPNTSKLFMAKATIQTGPDAGKTVYITPSYVTPSGLNGLVQAYLPRSPWGFDNVKAGDKLKIDNRDYVSFMFVPSRRRVISFYDFPDLRSAPNDQMPELQPLPQPGTSPIMCS